MKMVQLNLKILIFKFFFIITWISFTSQSYSAAWTISPGKKFISIEQIESKTHVETESFNSQYQPPNTNIQSKYFYNFYNEYGLSETKSLGTEMNLKLHKKNIINPKGNNTLTHKKALNKSKSRSSEFYNLNTSLISLTKFNLFLKYNFFKNNNISLAAKTFSGLSEQKKFLSKNDILDIDQGKVNYQSKLDLTYGASLSLGKNFKIFNNDNFIDLELGYMKNNNNHPIINFTYGLRDNKKMYLFKFIHQNEKNIFHRSLYENFTQNAYYLSKIQYKQNQPASITSFFIINKKLHNEDKIRFKKTQTHSKEIGFSLGIWIIS